ncbi:MAG TPA: diaminopimelate epimerase [Opitutaceae bacterium]|jgi:diaminopimelate epimerase
MRYRKYHALGNDYIVLDPADFPGQAEPSAHQVRVICHRNFGVGSDGILWGPLPSSKADFGLRIFNPDASEAEKSGNGLRIFSRFLWDEKLAKGAAFTIETPGGVVASRVRDNGSLVTVEMGCVSFDSAMIPVSGPKREVVAEELEVDGRRFSFSAATIGNPHCVIPVDDLSPELARRYGPGIEVMPLFPRRTNVQFMRAIDRSTIQIEIWERGAGYTLASGSSSSAAAAVAHRLGLVGRSVAVRMPGGTIGIEIGEGYAITMTGPVTRVADGTLDPEMFTASA